ncbi:MAG: YicC family protein [Calditrichaeota bacterium]|nr:MAG: YicC family protein [Calditrichota bacterium]
MISSMTGFGSVTLEVLGTTVQVEVKTVNHRFSEISTKLPKPLYSFEQEIREILKKRIQRGKITLVINFTNQNDVPSNEINETLAVKYFDSLTKLNAKLGISEEVKLDQILAFPDVIIPHELSEEEQVVFIKEICEGVEKATDKLLKMRLDEGKSLENDLVKRIEILEKTLVEIYEITKNASADIRENLTNKINNLLNDNSVIVKERLELEIAFLADKADVTEEITRFNSHNKLFLETIKTSEAPGRRMNFLLQEMNREANTIGSKSSKSEIAHFVVTLKEEIERIREQVQNIE